MSPRSLPRRFPKTGKSIARGWPPSWRRGWWTGSNWPSNATGTVPVYGLIVAKSGIKFKEGPDGGSHGQSSKSNNTHYAGAPVTMDTFAEFLTRRMDLPVLDMTGLKGFYDL